MFDALIDNFLLGYESQQTKRGYRWILSKAFKYAEEHGINKLETMDKTFYYSWVRSNAWGEHTRYTAYCALRAFLLWHFGEDSTPFHGFKVKHPKPRMNRTLKPAVMLRVLESIDTSKFTGRRMMAMLVLMLNTGMRSFEVASLRFDDLDLDKRSANVLCKGGIWRTAKFTDYTALCLASWLGARADLASRIPVEPFVFVSKDGRQIQTNTLRRTFSRMGLKAGLEHFSPHDMRRTFATISTIAGAPARIVMAAGGWTSLQSFMIYTQAVSPDDLQPYNPVDFVMGQ